MALALPKHRFSVGDYHRFGSAGVLDEDSRVELIDGELFDMAPIGSIHAAHVKRLNRLFSARLMDRAVVSVQDPVHLSDFSEPEPDLALLAPRADFYETAHPTGRDVLLLIEVSDTSVAYDRELKLPVYAAGGVREFWLLNLPDTRLEVYRRPTGRHYESVHYYGPEESISPLSFPDLKLSVQDML